MKTKYPQPLTIRGFVAYTSIDFEKTNALTKTVSPPKRFREPGLVGTGTSTWALNITSEQQAESAGE